MKKLSLVLAAALAVATMFMATSCQPIAATIADQDSAANYYKAEGTIELVTPQTGVSITVDGPAQATMNKAKNSNYESYYVYVNYTQTVGTTSYSSTQPISFIKINGKYYENYGTKTQKDITANIEGDVAKGDFKVKDYVSGTGNSAVKVNVSFKKI